jgi:hypothetical protein
MFKKRHLLILLLATVLIYSGAVYWSIQDYEEYKNARLERYPPDIRNRVVFDHYIISGRGILMIVLGAIIGVLWPVILFIKVKTKFQIAALATVIIAGAAFPLAYAAYKIFYADAELRFRFWENPDYFVSTVYWEFTEIVWISLGIFWLAVAAIRVLKPRLQSDQ